VFNAVSAAPLRPFRTIILTVWFQKRPDRSSNRSGEPGFVGRLKAQGALAAFGELPVGPTLGGCAAMPVDVAKIAATKLQ